MGKEKVDLILGIQWGDEGKGKFVDALAPNYDIIVRFQGGPNAGHTLEFSGRKHVLHTIPSGIFRDKVMNVIGNGVLIDAYIFKKELDEIRVAKVDPYKNLILSNKAHLILPTHRLLDAAQEAKKGDKKIGSTIKGIGPAYTDKTARCGLRLGAVKEVDFADKYNALKAQHTEILKTMGFGEDKWIIDGMPLAEYEKKWFEGIDDIKNFEILSTELYLNKALSEGKKVLAEGAQGTMLDVDFGSYPFVTSSSTVSGGACTGLGVPPTSIGKIYGVFKAYCTRVGSGPFPTEQDNADGEELRRVGHEFGATTGRARRCGWLDLEALRYAITVNGISDLIVTKADVLDDFDEITLCTSYDENGKPNYLKFKGWKCKTCDINKYSDLPKELKEYLDFVSGNVGVPISIVSLGPNRTQTIIR